MLISAEIRWFWPREAPAGLQEWFTSLDTHGCPAGGGQPRVDAYLRDPSQRELGIKLREGRGVEVKGLITILWTSLSADPFVGPIEIWAKWNSKALSLNETTTLKTKKTRWLRKFDTAGVDAREIPLDANEQPSSGAPLPTLGCNVELTQVEVNADIWWTLSFEAFGKTTTVANDLRASAAVLATRRPPSLGAASVESYAAWLSRHQG
jgi:hypothetical protein